MIVCEKPTRVFPVFFELLFQPRFLFSFCGIVGVQGHNADISGDFGGVPIVQIVSILGEIEDLKNQGAAIMVASCRNDWQDFAVVPGRQLMIAEPHPPLFPAPSGIDEVSSVHEARDGWDFRHHLLDHQVDHAAVADP